MNEITTFRPGALEEAKPDQMPHSIEAEQQLLGAILTNNDVFDRIAMIVSKDHFYDPVHARIFDVAAQRIAKNALASPVTLKTFLEDDEDSRSWVDPPISRVSPVPRSRASPRATMRR